jgi:hypothetical protein
MSAVEEVIYVDLRRVKSINTKEKKGSNKAEVRS